jgi:RimJ/RimL family protein N-acetyltransferase
MILSNSNITLHMWCDADIDPLTEAMVESISSLRYFIPWMNSEWSRVDSEKWVKDTMHKNASDWRAFSVYKDDKLIGSITLIINEKESNGKTIQYATGGYWMRDSFRGKGYCKEAMRLLISYGFDTLPIDYVKLVVNETNIASRHVAESIGGVIFKTVPERCETSDGVKHTGIIYRIYRKSFKEYHENQISQTV